VRRSFTLRWRLAAAKPSSKPSAKVPGFAGLHRKQGCWLYMTNLET
jgi:hypothetical protein